MDFKISPKAIKIIGGVCTGVGLLANVVGNWASSENQKEEIAKAAKEAVENLTNPN